MSLEDAQTGDNIFRDATDSTQWNQGDYHFIGGVWRTRRP
jgi:hypothetical protein